MPRAWLYKSKIGNLYIVPLKNGTFGLMHNNIIWESSYTPEDEAENVRAHVTGCDAWDSLDGKVDPPSDLSEWSLVNI